MIIVNIISEERNPWDNIIQGPFSSKDAAKKWIEEHAEKKRYGVANLVWDSQTTCWFYDGDSGGYEIVELPEVPLL